MIFLRYSILLLLAFTIGSCNKRTDKEAEEQAIKNVIEAQTTYYMAKDHDKNANLFVKDESLIILVAGKENYGYAEGWEQADYYNTINFNEDTVPGSLKFTNENYKIKIYDDAAWAVYDEMIYKTNGDFVKKVINVRFLEKHNGNWKIVFLGDVNTTSYKDNK